MGEVTDPALLKLLNGSDAPPPAPVTFPGVIPGRPKAPTPATPLQIAGDQRDEVRTGIAVRGEERDVSKTAFDQADKLRDDFSKRKPVENYQTIMRQYGAALGAADNLVGDQLLINSYATALNPTSTVMPAEYQAAENINNVATRVQERLKKEFGWDGAGRISDEARQWMIKELHSLTVNANKAYNQERQFYSDLATRYGRAPEEIIGPHAGSPYFETIRQSRLKQRLADGGELDGVDDDEVATAAPAGGSDPDGGGTRYNSDLTPEGLDIYPVDENGNKINDAAEAMVKGYDPDGAAGVGTLLAKGLLWSGSDEVAGLGGGLEALINNKPVIDGYRNHRDAERLRQNRASDAFGWGGTAIELGSGILTGGPLLRGGSMAANASLAGGATGWLSGEGTQGSALNAGVGALGGYAVGKAWDAVSPLASSAMDAISTYVPRRTAPAINREVIEAGARRDVPVRGPDARADMRLKRSELRTSPRVGQQIRESEADDLASIEAALTRDVGGGTGANRARVGDVAQEGATRARQTLRTRAQRHYTRAEKLSEGVVVEPREAIAAIDANIAELTANGPAQNKGLISYLQEVRSDLARDGGLSVAALRSQRTGLRGNLKERNLDATDAERRMGDVLDAAASDISRGLTSKPGALNEFRQGDQLWRERAQFTKQIAEKMLGPKDNPLSPDTTAARLEGWAAKDFGRFRRLWTELDEAERGEIKGHLADSLGRNAKGDFSLDYFLRHTGSGKGSLLSDKAARMVFGDEGMAAIRDLRVLSRAKLDAGAATNRSETGTVAQRLFTGLRHMLLTGLGFGAGDLSGAVAAPVAGEIITRMGEKRAAQLMLNPDFTKWLRNTPNTSSPAAINAHFGRLRSIGARAPAMNDNIATFETAVREAFGASPGRVAASTEQEDDARRVPPQQ